MNNSTVLSIPVLPRTKQFLLKEFGLPDSDVLKIHQNTFLGKSVLTVLQKLPYCQNRPKEVLRKIDLRVQLPTALKHFTITAESRKSLGDLLDKFMQQQMFFFIKGQVMVTGNELHAINMFLTIYEIDADTFDLETARKSWRDHKDKILKVNRLLQIPPQRRASA